MLIRRTVLLLCAALCLPAQTRDVWVASFDKVWQTIRDHHWDPERKGGRWDEARAELRPRIEQAQSDREARAILNELLGRLGLSHFAIIPANAYAALETGGAAGDASPGFEVRMVEGEPVVTRVLPGMAAAEAGVRPGWALRRIGGTELAPVLEKLQGKPLLQTVFLLRRLQGASGERRRYGFDSGGAEREVELALAVPPGRPVRFGHMPPMRMNIERSEPRPGIIHVAWNAFFEPQWLQDEFRAAVAGCGGCKGFILDVRGNGGGLGGLAPAVAAWFIETQSYLGTMHLRTGPLKLVAYPRPTVFSGPVALLVDGLSASTTEFLAAGLKDLDRARLFGETTPGAALPSVIELLPSGDRFQYAIADYVSLSGAAIEGRGVTPHLVVPLTRALLLEGRDPVLDAAIAWILERKEKQ